MTDRAPAPAPDDDVAAAADDEHELAALGGALAPLDLDATTAEQIARRARDRVGKPPSRRRWILPIVAAIVTVSYAVWAILRALEVFG